jgi:hypothetical protein
MSSRSEAVDDDYPRLTARRRMWLTLALLALGALDVVSVIIMLFWL